MENKDHTTHTHTRSSLLKESQPSVNEWKEVSTTAQHRFHHQMVNMQRLFYDK